MLSVSARNTQKSLGLESFFLMTCPDECQQDVYSWVIGIILAFIEKFRLNNTIRTPPPPSNPPPSDPPS